MLVRRADSELRWVLAATAVAFVAVVALVYLSGGSALVVLAGAGIAALTLLFLPMVRVSTRPYSRAGFLSYAVAILAFQAWSAIAFWATLLTGAPKGVAVTVQASAVVPLLAGAVVMSRRLGESS
jgi:hypothetical protein